MELWGRRFRLPTAGLPPVYAASYREGVLHLERSGQRTVSPYILERARNAMRLTGFRHKGLKRIHTGDKAKGVPAAMADKLGKLRAPRTSRDLPGVSGTEYVPSAVFRHLGFR